MFYWSFTSLVHFWPPPIFNPGYAYAVVIEFFFQFVLLILGILCLITLCIRHPLWASKLALVNYTFVVIILVNLV